MNVPDGNDGESRQSNRREIGTRRRLYGICSQGAIVCLSCDSSLPPGKERHDDKGSKRDGYAATTRLHLDIAEKREDGHERDCSGKNKE